MCVFFGHLIKQKQTIDFFALIAFCIKHMVTDRDLLDFSGHVTMPEQPKGTTEAVVIGLRKCPYIYGGC